MHPSFMGTRQTLSANGEAFNHSWLMVGGWDSFLNLGVSIPEPFL